MATIAKVMWLVIGPILKPMARRVMWAAILEAAEKDVTSGAGEKFRTSNLEYFGHKIDAWRGKLPNEGDQVTNRLADFLGGYYHSNRMISMGKGATWESALQSAEEVWSRVDLGNQSQFSGEHQA